MENTHSGTTYYSITCWHNINLWPKASWSKLTEGQPGLLNLQINIEVGGKTNVTYGSRPLFVVIILPVAVIYPYNRNTKSHNLLPTHEEKNCTVRVQDCSAHYSIYPTLKIWISRFVNLLGEATLKLFYKWKSFSLKGKTYHMLQHPGVRW